MSENKRPRFHRGVVFERMAIERCRSEEARKTLENYFMRRYQSTQAVGVKSHVTRKRKAEALDNSQSLQAGNRVEGKPPLR